MFYYSLGNIPPEYRSKTDSIQLLAIGKTRDEGGLSKLLAYIFDFVPRLIRAFDTHDSQLSSVLSQVNTVGYVWWSALSFSQRVVAYSCIYVQLWRVYAPHSRPPEFCPPSPKKSGQKLNFPYWPNTDNYINCFCYFVEIFILLIKLCSSCRRAFQIIWFSWEL